MTVEKRTNRAIRRENRNRIFRYICKNGRSSNPTIASALNMSLPTVLQNTRELQQAGYLYDAGMLDSTGGRKAKTVNVVADYRYSVGIDITRNHIVMVLTNLTGANVDRERIHLPFRDDESYYLRMRDILREFVSRSHIEDERILGVGVSIPGIVDHRTNRIDRSHVLGLQDFPLEKVASYIPYKTWFMNDANAGAFAEGFHAPDEDHFFYLSLNNTVGGCFYDRKKLLEGDNFRSGEIGHMILVPGGARCYCGKSGCSDPYCSALRLAEVTGNNLELFFEGLTNGGSREQERWKEYVSNVALLIHNIHMTLDCDIIIGGYVGSAMGCFIDDIRTAVRKLDLFDQEASYIRPCVFKISESAFGTALYEIESFISKI